MAFPKIWCSIMTSVFVMSSMSSAVTEAEQKKESTIIDEQTEELREHLKNDMLTLDNVSDYLRLSRTIDLKTPQWDILRNIFFSTSGKYVRSINIEDEETGQPRSIDVYEKNEGDNYYDKSILDRADRLIGSLEFTIDQVEKALACLFLLNSVALHEGILYLSISDKVHQLLYMLKSKKPMLRMDDEIRKALMDTVPSIFSQEDKSLSESELEDSNYMNVCYKVGATMGALVLGYYLGSRCSTKKRSA